jgi:rhodanese-related sulfurtransferase
MLLISTINYSCLSDAESEIQVVSAEEMQQISQLDEVQLVDIRTPEEYKEGHIAGFQNINYLSPNFEKEIEQLDKSKPVIVYCKTGNYSRKCTVKMKQKGFVKVYDLDGGIAKWKFKGFNIKSNP